MLLAFKVLWCFGHTVFAERCMNDAIKTGVLASLITFTHGSVNSNICKATFIEKYDLTLESDSFL